LNKYGILRALKQVNQRDFNTLMFSPLQDFEKQEPTYIIYSNLAVQANQCPSKEIIESIS
jgi:hypothetical protein